MATMGDVVRITNQGTDEFRQKHGGRLYRIPPGSTAIVSFEAMCLWLGHPDAVDIDKKRRFRSDEFRRLCVKWGVYEHHNLADERFPKLLVEDIEGDRIITVVDDPEGKHLTPDVQTRAERDRLQDQMQAMQRQMAALQAQIQQQSQDDAAKVAAGDTRTDEPQTRPEPIGTGKAAMPVPNPDENGGASQDASVDRPNSPRLGPRPVPVSQ